MTRDAPQSAQERLGSQMPFLIALLGGALILLALRRLAPGVVPMIGDDRPTADYWIPPEGAGTVRYDSPPPWEEGKNCGGTFRPGAEKLGTYLRQAFPGISDVGGYSCRQNTANKSETSTHGTGRALDLHVDPVTGRQVADWLVRHATEIGAQYVIWDRGFWSGRTGRGGVYTGPRDHRDHVHVELNEDGASGTAPWFQGGVA